MSATTHPVLPRPSLVPSRAGALRPGDLLRTEAAAAPALLRVTLGAVMFPHGAQHLLGWFGGYGFAGTHEWMTGTIGFPSVLATVAILGEFFGALALIAGFMTRLAAAGMIGLMLGAISTHVANGFFMNWFGALPAGAEGYEYHLLVVGMAIALVIRGGGALSVDRGLSKAR